MRKSSILAALACVLLAGCCNKAQLKLWVFNPLDIERTLETVEIPWNKVTEALSTADAAITPEAVKVLDAKGAEIPSQVIYAGKEEPQAIIFQATVPAMDHSHYVIVRGVPTDYPKQAFGRYVPERKDDYAWENNLTAWRIYGPALREEMVSAGIDVWSKTTGDLVIDEWYRVNNYHHDNGQGLDCYKVGVTLGGGASSPYATDKLWYAGNWAEWETLENGPIRTSVKLSYSPFEVEGGQASLVKIISLDANTHFNKVTDNYGGVPSLAIAAGMPMHEGAKVADGEGWIALTEPASDLQDPAAPGDISLGIVMPGVTTAVQADGHILIVRQVEAASDLVYYSGSGYSRFGVESPEAWTAIVERQAKLVNSPLQIEYTR
ncbi:MAG: DUF4861 domain-containing protein [Rikenellaceae bacterium]|jgi:hypothetical protein|nr:DUF4861 domain-containing protein [Rikenellaceae bacterium]